MFKTERAAPPTDYILMVMMIDFLLSILKISVIWWIWFMQLMVGDFYDEVMVYPALFLHFLGALVCWNSKKILNFCLKNWFFWNFLIDLNFHQNLIQLKIWVVLRCKQILDLFRVNQADWHQKVFFLSFCWSFQQILLFYFKTTVFWSFFVLDFKRNQNQPSVFWFLNFCQKWRGYCSSLMELPHIHPGNLCIPYGIS